MNVTVDCARFALAARDMGDERWLLLVLTLCLRTGLNPSEVEQRIVALATLRAPQTAPVRCGGPTSRTHQYARAAGILRRRR